MVLAVATPAAGSEQRQARLVYARGPGAESCPDENALRRSVAARLGYEAFKADAILGISVAVAKDENLLRARIRLEGENGESIGERELTARPHECGELASAIELAISIAIDPRVLTRQPEDSRAPDKATGPAPAPTTPTLPVVPPHARVASFHVGLGATGSLGSLPRASLGVTVNGWVQWARLSFGLEARADPQVLYAVAGGQTEAALLTGSAVVCLNESWFGGCLLASGGAMRVIGRGYDDSRQTTSPYAGGGIRAFIEIPSHRSFALRVHAEALVPLFRTVYLVNGVAVWTAPPVAGTLGISVVRHFW